MASKFIHGQSSARCCGIKKTPLNPVAIDSGSGLIAQYENLRSQACANGAAIRSLGYALFTRQGMVAWARAWRSCAIEPPAPETAAVAHDDPVPRELHTEVALVLAGIIFSLQRREVCSC